MPDDSVVLESIGPGGRGLRVNFYRYGDRWGHTIGFQDGPRYQPLLVSVEGRDQDDWPPSPPLQQLSRADSSAPVLAVGMAGTSHWSVSFEAFADVPSIRVDAASRIKHPAPYLGNRYRTMVSPTHQRGVEGVLLSVAPLVCRLQSLPTAEDELAQIEATQDSVAVTADGPIAGVPSTIRWMFQLQLVQ